MELGSNLLLRAGLSPELVEEIAAMMEYEAASATDRNDVEIAHQVA